MNTTSQAFEDLSQSLRVLLEARFSANQLFTVDFAEATGNIENAFTGVLNAFHSLYDAMAKDGIKDRVDWYKVPPLCAILTLRNARHHNLCSKIRTLFRYHLDTVTPHTAKQKYLMVNFKLGESDAITFDVPLSMGDLVDLLDMNIKESKLRLTTKNLLDEYIGLSDCRAYAEKKGLTIQKVFFNVIPLLINAGISLHPHIKDRIVHMSTESKHFDFHFREVLPAHTRQHEYQVFEFRKP